MTLKSSCTCYIFARIFEVDCFYSYLAHFRNNCESNSLKLLRFKSIKKLLSASIEFVVIVYT